MEFNFSPFPYLTTAQYELRPLQPTDEKEVFALRSDDAINQYLDRPKATSIDDAKQFIRKIIDGVANNLSIFWVITPKGESTFLGSICLWNLSTDPRKADLGFELLPRYHGKGIMQEVIPVVIQFGFEQMKLEKIEAELSPRNLKSARLLGKNNFTLAVLNKENPDSVIYELKRQGAITH
jgi:ribosomal-protein-alanine N-acetyltransferase